MPLEPTTQALSDSISKGNYKKALSFCDKLLEINSNNEAVRKTKCLCYIQLGNYNDALSFIQSCSKDLQQTMITETAYSMYKLRKHQETLDLLASVASLSTTQLHLIGQTHYRMGDHEKAIETFEQIKKQDDSAELEVNIAAARCIGKVIDDFITTNQKNNTENYELAHNIACVLLQNNDLSAAEQQLLLAEKIANETLPEQEFTESEIIDELAGIRTQLAYIYQVTNRESKASELYKNVLNAKPSDISVAAIASNNSIALQKDHKLFNAEKILFNAVSAAEEHKITPEQEKVINFNRAVVYLKMGKKDKCREIIDELSSSYPNSPLPALIQAALLFKENNIVESEKILQSSAEKGDLTTQLTLAQLLLKDGKVEECIKALENLGDNSFRLGVVATRVKLYEKLGKFDDANSVIDSAVQFWENKKDSEARVKILAAAANYKFEKEMFKEAADIFKTLLDLDKNNREFYVSKLIISLSTFDPDIASSYADKLPEISYSGEEVSIDKLENINAYRATRESKEEEVDNTSKVVERKKNKKKKKKRLPKNYDPNVTPDPERWLPRTQRSSFKKRKNKMRGRHQGQDLGNEPTKPAQASNTSTQTTNKPAQAPPASNKPKQQKKKQKKGKKKGKR